MNATLINVKNFLHEFSISRTSFYREVASGRLRITKRGKTTLVAREDAEAWLRLLREETEVAKSTPTTASKGWVSSLSSAKQASLEKNKGGSR